MFIVTESERNNVYPNAWAHKRHNGLTWSATDCARACLRVLFVCLCMCVFVCVCVSLCVFVFLVMMNWTLVVVWLPHHVIPAAISRLMKLVAVQPPTMSANIIHKQSVSIPPETHFVYMLKKRCLMNIWKTIVLSDTELKNSSWSNQRSCHYLIGYSPQIMSCAVDFCRKCATWHCATPDHIGTNHFYMLLDLVRFSTIWLM